MRHRILLAASFIYLAAANLIWISRDTRPPFWDMAVHANAALRIYDKFETSGLKAFASIPFLTGYYPPAYHIAIAVVWLLFGKSIAVARLANLIPVAILLISTYGIGRTVLSKIGAASAAMLVSFYPGLIWLSRETMIDYWLAAIVALAIWILISSREFSNRRLAVAFGAVCGLGMLTKWYFPFFVLLPALWLARRNWKNAVIAAAIAAVIAAYWYIPAAPALRIFFKINTAGGVAEGDPGRVTWQAVIFYVRLLAGYQIFAPLFLAFLAGLVLVWKNYDPKWLPILLWIAGGWLGLMLFQNKDPRYSAPLLSAVAIITAAVIDRKPVMLAALIPFLMFQHYLVSFGIKRIPESIVLMHGVAGPMSWDWNLYRQNYFELWGPPKREDWKIQHVLDTISNGGTRPATLGIIPDIPRFDFSAFEFSAHLLKIPVTIKRLGAYDEADIRNNDYILLSETGSSFVGSDEPNRERIDSYVFSHAEKFLPVEWFPLPNGQVIRLYKVQ